MFLCVHNALKRNRNIMAVTTNIASYYPINNVVVDIHCELQQQATLYCPASSIT